MQHWLHRNWKSPFELLQFEKSAINQEYKNNVACMAHEKKFSTKFKDLGDFKMAPFLFNIKNNKLPVLIQG